MVTLLNITSQIWRNNYYKTMFYLWSCCHGNRLEAELEEKRLREREEMMAELQAMKDAAQVEMDRQKTDYELRITQLARDMVSRRSLIMTPN